MGAETFLPYHCPKFGNFLRLPCAGQVAAAKERRAKFPHALLGALEHCLACEGRNLITREAPVSHLDGKSGPGPGLVDPSIAPQSQDILSENEMKSPLASKEEPDMTGAAVKFKDAAEAERFLGPGKIPVKPPPRCPKHPNEPQVSCSPTGKRAGQYMGACKVCMAKCKVGRNPNPAKDKMTPAVARDLGKVKGVMAAATKPSPPAAASHALPADAHGVQPGRPRCITHNLPIKFNAKGISMGGCEECRREIAAMGGRKAKIQLAQNPVGRIFADYPDELAWLLDQARDQLRTPDEQLVFLVRQAMRNAG